jgi:hypothetical protein
MCTLLSRKLHFVSWKPTSTSVWWAVFRVLWVISQLHVRQGLYKAYYLLFFIIVSGVRLSPLGIEPTTGLLYQPQMIDDGDCGETGGMKIGRGNRSDRSTRRKPASAPLCPPQIPHDQTRARTLYKAYINQTHIRPPIFGICNVPHPHI